MYGVAPLRQWGRAIGNPHAAKIKREKLQTGGGVFLIAGMTGSAGVECEYDMIAHPNAFNSLADCLNHARTFVAQHDGHRNGKAVSARHIGMAYADSDHAHQHFITSRRSHLNGFNPEGPTCLAYNGCLGGTCLGV